MIVVVGSPALAGAHAKLPFVYAHEDPVYAHTQNAPHPVNAQYSVGKILADVLKESFMLGRLCANEREVLAEIQRVRNEFQSTKLFFVAESFDPTSQSIVKREVGVKVPGIVVSVKYSTVVPAFSKVAADYESFSNLEYFMDRGHRLFANVILQYIVQNQMEHFTL